jgi:hypothetical protein
LCTLLKTSHTQRNTDSWTPLFGCNRSSTSEPASCGPSCELPPSLFEGQAASLGNGQALLCGGRVNGASTAYPSGCVNSCWVWNGTTVSFTLHQNTSFISHARAAMWISDGTVKLWAGANCSSVTSTPAHAAVPLATQLSNWRFISGPSVTTFLHLTVKFFYS